MVRTSTKALVWVCLGLLVMASLAWPFQRGSPKKRFIVQAPGRYVLDVRTSLRWQKEPGRAEVRGAGAACNGGNTCVWWEAVNYCAALENGSRLPEVKELISLVDYSVASPGPVLPADHPFQKVQMADYWTATTIAGSPDGAWNVSFGGGLVEGKDKNVGNFVWCVR